MSSMYIFLCEVDLVGYDCTSVEEYGSVSENDPGNKG